VESDSVAVMTLAVAFRIVVADSQPWSVTVLRLCDEK
jgi:hypothetical protein